MMKLFRLALALAAISYVSATQAASTFEAPANSGQRFQGMMLVDPTTGQPVSPSTGGGGSGGGAVYGPDNAGVAPTKPPVLMGLLDASGNVRSVSSTYALPTADALADQGIGTPADTAAAVGGNGSTIAQLKQAVTQLSSIVAKLTSGTSGTINVGNFPATQPVSGTVTSNLGTLNGAALDTSVQAVKTTLGSPFQAGGSIGNTTFASTIADGADVALGSKADAANAATGSTAMAIFRQLHADLIAPPPASQAGPSLGASAALGIVQQDGQATTVSASAAGALTNATYATGAIPTVGYQSGSIEITSPGTGNTLVVEGSNTGTNWQAIAYAFTNAGGTSQSFTSLTAGAGYILKFPLPTAFVRVRVSAYGSGTVTTAVTLKSAPMSLDTAFVVPSVGTSPASPQFAAEAGSSTAATGISPVVTNTGTSAVGKASAGNLYSAYAVNSAATLAYLVCIDAPAAPTAGGAITPKDVAFLNNTVGATAQINYGAGPPNTYTTGITCLVTTSLTTYTAGPNDFISVRAR